MKRLLIFSTFVLAAVLGNAQQTNTASLKTAKTSYKSGKLEDAHFALQQTLVELDMTIGKELIKLLPPKMDTLIANTKEDEVSANSGFLGATIRREYGRGEKTAKVDIVTNSPLLGTLNAFLTSPLMNLGNNGATKVVKVQGYKARLTKEEGSENEKPSYRLEVPFSNALFTLAVNNTSNSEVLAMANTIPLAEIAKLIQ